jgi:hypothetical protein
VALGKTFLEMCHSLYFVNNPQKKFEDFDVFGFFKESGYEEIARK